MTKRERIANDLVAEAALNRLAEQIRKSDHRLSREAALVKAYERRPDWYARMRRHEERQAGYAVDIDLSEIGKSEGAYAELEAKAHEIRQADSTLTREQALVRAYERNPDLYARARRQPVCSCRRRPDRPTPARPFSSTPICRAFRNGRRALSTVRGGSGRTSSRA